MKVDPNWVLVSGLFIVGTMGAVVIGAAGFFFFSGYHSGSTQCPKPALIK